MSLIQNTLPSFHKISLADLDQVKLMNRIDHKFCLHCSFLPSILEALKSFYSILEIQGETIFQYDNTYFDTSDNQMYINHQNGKRNRYKIRLRQYVQSNDNFLEIKFKTNKGRTIKKRISRPDFNSAFNEMDLDFIENHLPYIASELQPKITSNFHRMTLVDKNFTERVTIDTAPGFKNQNNEVILENLVIIEVKHSKAINTSPIIKVLKEYKIRSKSFSKYCIGRSLLEEKLKKNNFKPLLLKINKEYAN